MPNNYPLHACRGEAASKGIHEDLGTALTHLMPLVNMAFFSLAGASLLLVGLLQNQAWNAQSKRITPCFQVQTCVLLWGCVNSRLSLFMAGESGGNAVGGSGGVYSAAACSLPGQLDGRMDGRNTHRASPKSVAGHDHTGVVRPAHNTRPTSHIE